MENRVDARTCACVSVRFGISAWRFYDILIVSRIYRPIKSDARRSDREMRNSDFHRDYCGSERLVITRSHFDKRATIYIYKMRVCVCIDSINLIDTNRFCFENQL